MSTPRVASDVEVNDGEAGFNFGTLRARFSRLRRVETIIVFVHEPRGLPRRGSARLRNGCVGALGGANLQRTSFGIISGLFAPVRDLGAVSFSCRVQCLSPRHTTTIANHGENWSERGDLNSRPPVPQTGALTELRYAPTLETKHFGTVWASTNQELPPICRQHYHFSIPSIAFEAAASEPSIK